MKHLDHCTTRPRLPNTLRGALRVGRRSGSVATRFVDRSAREWFPDHLFNCLPFSHRLAFRNHLAFCNSQLGINSALGWSVHDQYDGIGQDVER
jgi:hypothetical protein